MLEQLTILARKSSPDTVVNQLVFGNHKLVKARGGSGDWELYDLAADLGETKNLAAEKPAVAKELLAKYDAWNASNIKPLWGAPAGGGKGKAGLKKLLEQEQE